MKTILARRGGVATAEAYPAAGKGASTGKACAAASQAQRRNDVLAVAMPAWPAVHDACAMPAESPGPSRIEPRPNELAERVVPHED